MPVLAGVAPSELGWSHVTVCPTIVQLAKAPLAAIGVRPAGSVSVVENPADAICPAGALISNSNVCVWPTVKSPMWLLVIDRSGGPRLTVTRSSEQSLAGLPSGPFGIRQ